MMSNWRRRHYGPILASFASCSAANLSGRMLCQPWTFGDYSLHIANNTDYTVTPENGKMVLAQGCTAISSVDPQIAAYHKVAG
jgi:hypothetical protein